MDCRIRNEAEDELKNGQEKQKLITINVNQRKDCGQVQEAEEYSRERERSHQDRRTGGQRLHQELLV